MKRKILVLSNSGGGLFHFRGELMKELVNRGHEVTINVPEDSFSDELVSYGCVLEACLFDSRGTNPIKDFGQLQYYRKLMKRLKPDIVLTYTIKPNVYGGMACVLEGVPYVSNITGLGSAVENPGILQKITLALYRIGLRKAQKVFFQNTTNRDFMVQQGVVKDNYDMLPGSGVNLEKFMPQDYPRNETIDFIFVGRIMREKGIEQYLDAARAIRRAHPETRFHICGGCKPEYVDVLKQEQEKGTVIYHGHVKDMTAIHAFSCCTVHPSFYPEGMSNVLLESCASCRPVITTDRPGCREVVDVGVNGYLVKQRDSRDLIEKIEKFLALSWEQRRDMGLAGRAKVEREFDRKLVTEKYLVEIEGI